jgi:tetratricopeptide (TPR) repeat protein
MTLLDRNGAARKVAEAERVLVAQPTNTQHLEALFREALAMDPGSQDAARGLATSLCRRGLSDEALSVLAPFLADGVAGHALLVTAAEANKVSGRPDVALSLYRRAAAENASAPLASHNLAAILGDLSQFEEAEARARDALSRGLDLPQTWLVLARACLGTGKLDDSEAAFRKVLALDQLNGEAWRELCQLIWMRTGSADEALRPLDDFVRATGADPRLLEIRALAFQSCGDMERADQTIRYAVNTYPGDVAVRTLASRLAIQGGRPSDGLMHAEAAVAAAPNFWSKLALCEALFAVGDARRASGLIEDLRRQAPLHQNVIAYQATAWRMLGDERYPELYDYERTVSAQPITTPKGWSSLPEYLADLTQSLTALHRQFKAHPFSQSLLNGSQVSNLLASTDPVVRAFFEAVAEPIRVYLERLGSGPDVLRVRNTFDTQVRGIWSVRLRGGGGRHVNHVHSQGWLSSACYIALPQTIGRAEDRDGWLKFGEPGIITRPPLPPQHFVRPEPGLLALFPSYMWHGTEAFKGDEPRLSIAFDLTPKTA